MAKSTKETKGSTVVLNEDVNTKPTDTTTNTETTTPDKKEDCDKHGTDSCTCKPGHCPKKECANYWTTGTKVDEYVYHFDSDDETVKLEDADHRKANPTYEKPTDPTPSKPDTPETPSHANDGCPNDLEEPWAHDKLMDKDDKHTSLEKELKYHTGSNWDIVEYWVKSVKEEKDADKKAKLIQDIAWHIPTGGTGHVKEHHKDLIVAELKKL